MDFTQCDVPVCTPISYFHHSSLTISSIHILEQQQIALYPNYSAVKTAAHREVSVTKSIAPRSKRQYRNSIAILWDIINHIIGRYDLSKPSAFARNLEYLQGQES